jgi:glucan 1,3-beta-glucosidase
VNFANESNPKVMFQMGSPGTHGLIEVSDILFDVAEPLPGAILVENNVSGFDQGSVGMWDTHFKVGGTEDSAVEVRCPSYPIEGKYNVTSCKAAFMFLHLQPESSIYIESMWGWTVNRDLDGLTGSTNGTSQAIAVGRGLLVESQKSTWLVGTAFEHCTLYQYQLASAENVYMLMAQTETVYWQPNPPAPAPFVSVLSSSSNFRIELISLWQHQPIVRRSRFLEL